jgi:hypothetical protein
MNPRRTVTLRTAGRAALLTDIESRRTAGLRLPRAMRAAPGHGAQRSSWGQRPSAAARRVWTASSGRSPSDPQDLAENERDAWRQLLRLEGLHSSWFCASLSTATHQVRGPVPAAGTYGHYLCTGPREVPRRITARSIPATSPKNPLGRLSLHPTRPTKTGLRRPSLAR